MTDTTNDLTSSRSGSELLRRVRSVVHELLYDGTQPSEISFVLALVATELGLAVAQNPLSVLPVVLSGVSQAVWTLHSEEEEDTGGLDDESQVQGSYTIH